MILNPESQRLRVFLCYISDDFVSLLPAVSYS